MFYSAGGCSVCAEGGDAVFVYSLRRHLVFFHCPSCGCAWPEPPEVSVVDVIETPEQVAAGRWRVATRAEIDDSAWRDRVARTVDPDTYGALALRSDGGSDCGG